MDKKNILVVAIISILVIAWHPFILPMLPDSLTGLSKTKQKKNQPSTSGNTNTSTTNSATTTNSTNTQTTVSSTITPVTSGNTQTAEAPKEVKVKEVPALPKVEEKKIVIETDIFEVHLSNKGGIIEQLLLKEYFTKVDSKDPLPVIKKTSFSSGENPSNMKYKVTKNGKKQSITFSSGNFRKVYEFEEGQYTFKYFISGGGPNQREVLNLHSFEPASMGMFMGDRMCGGFFSIIGGESNGDIYTSPNLTEEFITREFDSAKINYIGFRNKYFTCLIEPSKKNESLSFKFSGKNETESNLSFQTKANDIQEFTIYAGPVDDDHLRVRDPDKFLPMYDYYGIDIIIHFLLWFLDLLSKIPGVNMGFAIILLTIIVKIVLFPLNLKAQTSMFMMSKVGPEMKKLQEKYKNDRQQLGIEQMKLFKDAGVNPLAGCLPMFIQMPVFISLFAAVGDGFILRHQPFLFWINDVSAPDALMTFEFSIPLIGPFVSNADGTTHLNLLIFIYLITIFLQQSMMPKSTDPQQQQMQKMMKVMMFFFGFILYNYSSGLIIYFIGSNTLGMMESWYIKKKVIPAMEKKREQNKKSKNS